MERNVLIDLELDIKFMNQREFLTLTHLSRYRMKSLVKKGKLRVVIIDGYYLLERESVKELLGLTKSVVQPEQVNNDLFAA